MCVPAFRIPLVMRVKKGRILHGMPAAFLSEASSRNAYSARIDARATRIQGGEAAGGFGQAAAEPVSGQRHQVAR